MYVFVVFGAKYDGDDLNFKFISDDFTSYRAASEEYFRKAAGYPVAFIEIYEDGDLVDNVRPTGIQL